MLGRYLDTKGIRLHYLDYPGDGPTLILMQEPTANAHASEGLIRAGLSPQLRVLAVDLSGAAVSATVPTALTGSRITSTTSSV